MTVSNAEASDEPEDIAWGIVRKKRKELWPKNRERAR